MYIYANLVRPVWFIFIVQLSLLFCIFFFLPFSSFFFFLILHRLPFTPCCFFFFLFRSVYYNMPFCALFPLIPRSFRKQRKGVVLVFAIIFNQTLLFEQLINSNDETLHDTPTHANNLQRVTDEICLFTANAQFSTYLYSAGSTESFSRRK